MDNPVEVLRLCRNWIEDDGKIFAAVPNARSIHRQAACKMGLLKSIYDFSEKDRRNGHQRVFDMEQFQSVFQTSGWNIVERGGYWLKPLSDRQIESAWTKEMIDAFFALGEEYPEIAGEIYIIAEKA